MAKSKIYMAPQLLINDDRLCAMLGVRRFEVEAYAVAPTKIAAVGAIVERGLSQWVREQDLRLADRNVSLTRALLEAGLLTEDGKVLVISSWSNGPFCKVVSVDLHGYAHLIGEVRGDTFHPAEARYATEGSVAVGKYEVAIKGGAASGGYWRFSDGRRLDDEAMQVQLDLGNCEITRAGYGDRYGA